MTTKLFEVRDDGTLIVVLAAQLNPGNDDERKLLARAGYGTRATDQSEYVFLCNLNGSQQAGHYDPFSWQNRTMREAHRHIVKNFGDLENCQVIDVEYIIGVRAEPKKSEVL